MANPKRSWLVLLVALALCLVSGDGTAQQEQPVDLWQFPKLVNSKPFQRWWWTFQQRAYPLGYIPKGALRRALREIEQTKASLSSPSQLVQGDRWVNIGPAPILGGDTSPTSPVSGRVGALAVDPHDSNHWLLGAAQGGIGETHVCL